LGLPADDKTTENSVDEMSALPSELAKKAAERIKAAVDMGDVMKIKSIAEELKSQSASFAPVCDKLINLADDFDFDGIQKIITDIT
jgi:hypothetical protein